VYINRLFKRTYGMFDFEAIEAGHSTCLFFLRRFEGTLLIELVLYRLLLEFGHRR